MQEYSNTEVEGELIPIPLRLLDKIRSILTILDDYVSDFEHENDRTIDELNAFIHSHCEDVGHISSDYIKDMFNPYESEYCVVCREILS